MQFDGPWFGRSRSENKPLTACSLASGALTACAAEELLLCCLSPLDSRLGPLVPVCKPLRQGTQLFRLLGMCWPLTMLWSILLTQIQTIAPSAPIRPECSAPVMLCTPRFGTLAPAAAVAPPPRKPTSLTPVSMQADSGDFAKQQAARQQVEITQLQAKLVGAQAGVREAERHLQDERARLGNSHSNAQLLAMAETLQQEVRPAAQGWAERINRAAPCGAPVDGCPCLSWSAVGLLAWTRQIACCCMHGPA